MSDIKRVLVTGVGGDVGSKVAIYLAKVGFEVIGTARKHSERLQLAQEAGVAIRWCPLLRSQTLDGPFDAVVHCAASPSPGSTPEAVINDNILGHKALVEAAANWDLKLFIFMSSTAVYGPNPAVLINERTPFYNPSDYGCSKIYGEWLLQQYVDRFPSLALRVSNVIGVGCQSGWLNRAVTDMLNDKIVDVYNYDMPVNGFVHISNLCHFITTLFECKHDKRFDTVVCGSSDSIAVGRIIERLTWCLKKGNVVKNTGQNHNWYPLLDSSYATSQWGFKSESMRSTLDRLIQDIQNVVT